MRYRRPMKQLFPAFCALLVLAICSARAADESIDRLISKLPPPQKFVDPAINDPATKQINAALKAHNFGVALDLSRRLAGRYPKSLGAQMVHGILAMSVREFREASNAYQKALSIWPDFPFAYVGLGMTDAAQNRFAAALSDFQRVTRIAPQLDIGWVGSSACAEKLGRTRESLEFAKRGTTAAPSSVGAWLQRAREEGISGSKQAAQAALAKANQLRRNAPKR
jgi:tetratricopeptide (TPR) repeat protein